MSEQIALLDRRIRDLYTEADPDGIVLSVPAGRHRLSRSGDRAANSALYIRSTVITDKPLRVVLADDHPVYRDGLARLLTDLGGFDVVGLAADGAEAITLAAQQQPAPL